MDKISNQQNNIKQYIYSFVIVTLLFTNQYSGFIEGVTLAEVLLLSCIVMTIIDKRNILSKGQLKLIYIWIFVITLTVISLHIQGSYLQIKFISRILRTSLIIISIVILIGRLKLQKLLKVYKYFVIISIIYIFIQTIFYKLGVQINTKILPIPYYNSVFVNNPYAENFFRPAGFYSEPAMFSQFLLPAIVFSIIGWDKKEANYVLLIFILLGIIISTSTLGIALAIILVVYSFYVKYKRNQTKLILVVAITSISIFIVLNILEPQLVTFTLSKLNIFDSAVYGSEGIRIFRGWSIFYQIPDHYKMIGIGHGNLGNFLTRTGITSIYDTNDLGYLDYASGISLSFLYYGIIPGTLYLGILIKFFIDGNGTTKALMLCYIIISLVSSTLFDPLALFYFTLIYLSKNERDYQNDKNIKASSRKTV